MKKNAFKLTFYFGLSIFLIPIFIITIALIYAITGNSKTKEEIKPKPEVVFETKETVIYDTVFVEKPKSKPSPKILVEEKKIDSTKNTDTVNKEFSIRIFRIKDINSLSVILTLFSLDSFLGL
jgi:hypothetical protein